MSSRNTVTKITKNRQSNDTEEPYYLAHELEPIDNHRTFTPDEIRQELYESRFYLKQRVWRNMRKIRRNPQVQYRFAEPELKTLKPRLVN